MPHKDPEKRKEYARAWRARNSEKQKIYMKEYRTKYKYDPAKQRENRLKWKKRHPERHMVQKIRESARKRGLQCDLSIRDLTIPEYCPVLGIRINGGHNKDSRPTVDRINNNKGYTKDNIKVISFRANRIKSDASIEEVEKILAYMRGGIRDEH